MLTTATAPARTCTEPGCIKAHRARGLCSTHYNQMHQPGRHAPKVTACAVCGQPVLRPPSSRRKPACSTACRRVIQHGTVPVSDRSYDWTQDAARRARLAGATVIEDIDREAVHQRDGWVCYLCGRRTDPEASPFDPSSPTVDHVVPLSRHGEHTMANVRTACLGCNSSKQDREPARPADGGHGG